MSIKADRFRTAFVQLRANGACRPLLASRFNGLDSALLISREAGFPGVSFVPDQV